MQQAKCSVKLNAEEIYFFTSKVIFKVKSAFQSGRIATNENMDVIKMNLKTNCFSLVSKSIEKCPKIENESKNPLQFATSRQK